MNRRPGNRRAHGPADAATAAEQVRREAVAGDDEVAQIMTRVFEAGIDSERPYGRRGRPFGRGPFATGLLGAIGALLAITIWKAAAQIESTLLLIVMALFLAVGLNGFVERLVRRGLSRRVSVSIVFLFMLAFFVFAAATLIPTVFAQVAQLVTNAPHLLDDLQKNATVRRLDDKYGIIARARTAITGSSVSSHLVGGLVGAGKSLVGAVFQLLTLLILTIYFLSSLGAIKGLVYRLFPRDRRPRAALLGDEILERTGGYIGGALAIAAIAGFASFVFLAAARVHYALSLAIIIAITDLIPMIGATIGAAIGVTFALSQSLGQAIATLIFFIVYQQVENYLIYPRVMNKAVDVHPAAAVVAALVGGTLLGFAGALLAIPMAAAMQLVLEEVVFPRQEGLRRESPPGEEAA
jgi:predicted PurR-regulated permease PerM